MRAKTNPHHRRRSARTSTACSSRCTPTWGTLPSLSRSLSRPRLTPSHSISRRAMAIMNSCVLLTHLTSATPRLTRTTKVHGRHLRPPHERGAPAQPLRRKANRDVSRDPDGRAPAPPGGARQARRLRRYKGGAKILFRMNSEVAKTSKTSSTCAENVSGAHHPRKPKKSRRSSSPYSVRERVCASRLSQSSLVSLRARCGLPCVP